MRTISKARSKAFRNNRRKRQREKPKGQSMLLMDRFSKFSSLSLNNIQQILGDDNSAFNELIKNEFIEKGSKSVKIKKAQIEYYQLTNKGRNFLKKQGYCNYYSRSPRHDIIHATNILDNFSKAEIDTYKHEKELAVARYDDTSRVDGCLIDSFGKTIYIETATFNYTKPKLDAKIKYYNCQCYNGNTPSELIVFDERRR